MDVIIELRDSLKTATGTELKDKLEGLNRLDRVLIQNNPKLVEYGYDEVLLKELLKFVKFEEGEVLKTTLDLIQRHYAQKEEYQDEILENLLYRYGLTTNQDVSIICLESISDIIDHMGDNVAKHSKQLLQLTEITLPLSQTSQFEEILVKLRSKLPKRRTN